MEGLSSPSRASRAAGKLKAGIDVDKARRRRETHAIQIRKEKREDGIQKRRLLSAVETEDGASASGSGVASSTSASTAMAATEANLPYFCDGKLLYF